MKVYIVGEDPVTYAIIKRILSFCSGQFEIISELPARGGEIKNKIPQFNQLSNTNPVILLTDLDNNLCAPELLKKLIPAKNQNFIFNIAVDEAEAWLMADRRGFANYFSIDINLIPLSHRTKQGGRTELTEMNFSYKSSMYFTHELAKRSTNSIFVKQFIPKQGAAKGPEYNSAMLPFIQNIWNIDSAKENSDSLNRMISRINELHESVIV